MLIWHFYFNLYFYITPSCVLLGTVHTNPDKFENASFFMFFLRFGQLSTLKRRFGHLKTELCENGLQAGKIWKRRLGGVVWTAEKGGFRKRWRQMVMWSLSQSSVDH